MTLVRRHHARRVETPNATMTTYASPALGGSIQALWQVEMAPGATGPVHVMDAEQIWTVLTGSAAVTVDGERIELAVGDTLVLAAGRTRQIAADPASGLTAIVTGRGADVAGGPGREPTVPPWIA
ncbi:cupin domain-containing protein [Actinomycetospora endophytica]|uniref:Cupin domain-containing protein n=1 Tax=Actinomycetospora endophytica TaxID=2291215 RepID=A0ABS8PBP5_9PSEU|nr:cupin domain-containing protein [Actinomycetospora endophytica]MCD2195683.1 cupin domain-containing protein [Actinomycetospora endophytica]